VRDRAGGEGEDLGHRLVEHRCGVREARLELLDGPGNSDPHGTWSDGTTLWVSHQGVKRLFAYRLPDPPDAPAATDSTARSLERVREEEFTELSHASNNSPRGLWSDGAVMYVVDANDGKVYSYNMPNALDARLASLAPSGVELGEFDPATTDYQGAPQGDVSETTVEARAAQPGAEVAISPPDHDGDAGNGHQVALAGAPAITVTSPDGSRERVYRVSLGAAAWDPLRDPWPHCFAGAVAVGFSHLVSGGGIVDDLAACAEERHVTALYALSGGEWVPYILGARAFVNRAFTELYPGVLPAATPLVARSGGPASPDPFDGDPRVAGLEPWPECLRGEVAPGFSLLLSRGGGTDELVSCAEGLGVSALYALSGGE
jgi:hypothetical protein